MINAGKRSVLGVSVDVVDYEGAAERIMSAASHREPLSVTALAVHGVMSGVLDPELRYRLNRLSLVTPDGQPVRWALNLLHREPLPDRVYGPRLMELVCERAATERRPVFLYGSRPQTLDALQHNLLSKFPALHIAGAEPSKFRRTTLEASQAIDDRIRASGASIVFVGLGCPRQETFAYEHASALSCPVIAVGAAFDYHAGTLPLPPAWMQRAGLEWLFRLSAEPVRLWRRYLLLNPLYCLLIVGQMMGLSRYYGRERLPTSRMNYE